MKNYYMSTGSNDLKPFTSRFEHTAKAKAFIKLSHLPECIILWDSAKTPIAQRKCFKDQWGKHTHHNWEAIK